MDGLVYLLNQSGLALAQANDLLAQKDAYIKKLEEILADLQKQVEGTKTTELI